jgi:hypothetical protein
MKCLICQAEIDELKEFPATPGPGGQLIEDTLGKWKHAQAVGAWTHVTLTAQVSAGTVTVLSGNVCPAHPVTSEGLMLAAKPVSRSADPTPIGSEKKTSEAEFAKFGKKSSS